MSNKKRRFDTEAVTDTDISDFLDTRPDLYKQIQLSCFLDKCPAFFSNANSLKELAFEIHNHIKRTVLNFYPELEFWCSRKGKEIKIITGIGKLDTEMAGNLSFSCNSHFNEKYNGKHYVEMNFWIYNYSEDLSVFFNISGESFNKYFLTLSELLSKQFNCDVSIKVESDSDWGFEISISAPVF